MSTDLVVTMHEPEAALVHQLVVHRLRDRNWDLSDEGQWSEAKLLKLLEEKLSFYLERGKDDGPVSGIVSRG